MPEPLRLHIGGKEPKHGWKILNIQPGPHVDFVGDCTDLGDFEDGVAQAIYASHVLEHLGYQEELPRALKEFHRVLAPGGELMISVPDLHRLCQLFLRKDATPEFRFHVMRIMFGGQIDAHDFHRTGLTEEFLGGFLRRAGFASIRRVEKFDLFEDASGLVLAGVPISLNVLAGK